MSESNIHTGYEIEFNKEAKMQKKCQSEMLLNIKCFLSVLLKILVKCLTNSIKLTD